MSVVSLGYAVIGSRNLAEWQDFGTSMLGLHCAERSSSLLGFRMDSKRRRILVDGSAPDGTCCFAWDMGDAGGLAALAARVEAAAGRVQPPPAGPRRGQRQGGREQQREQQQQQR